MSDKDKWSQPSSPPPPLFLGEKERDLVKQVNDEVIEYGSADWPIQLDGLNVDQILNLSTEPEDNGHHHLSDCDSSYTPETPQYENSSPIGVRFARSPNYPCLDSPRFPTPPDVFGRATPCNNCPNYTRLGYCWCPRRLGQHR